MLLAHLQHLAAPASSDATLLTRWLTQRDEAAFTAIVVRHGPMVLSVCRRILGDAQHAEDAFQATFLVLARKAAHLRRPEALASFLYGVALRLARKARAASARRPVMPLNPETPEPVDPSPHPLDVLSGRELLALLDAEMTRLPDVYRLPLLLCMLQGRTLEEAARQLGWSVGSLRGRLERGRARLQQRLSRRGLDLSVGVAALLAPVVVPESLLAASVRQLGSPAPASILALTGGWTVALRGKTIGMGLFLLTMAGLGASLPLLRAPQPQPSPGAAPSVPPAQARSEPHRDRYGDPLPPHAVARLGTARFRHEGEAHSLVFSPNGKVLAALTAEGGVLWDARTGEGIRRLPQLAGSLTIGRLIDFSPDGRRLAAPRDNNHVGLWDAASGKLLQTFAVLPKHKDVLEPPGSCCLHTIRFSPDGRFLAVEGDDNRSYVLDAATGKVWHHFKEEIIACPTFSPDGKTFVLQVWGGKRSKGHEIQVCDVSTGKVLRHWEAHSELICDIAFSPDAKLLAAAGTDRITIWDAVTGEVHTRIKKKMGQIKNLAFTHDGKTLLAGSEEVGRVHFWDVATGKEQRQLDPRMGLLRSMTLSADGKTVAAGGVYNTIRLWDVATGRELFPDQTGHNAPVDAVAFSPDGKLLASGGENRQIWIWDIATGKPVRQLRGTGAAVAFSPDSKRLAAVGRYDGDIIRVWDIASGAELLSLSDGEGDKNRTSYRVLAFAPDGKTLRSVDWKNGHAPCLGCVHVWDTATGRRLHRSESSLTDPRPQCVAFSPDGKTLALGGDYDRRHGAIRLWDLQAGKEIMDLKGHEGDFLSLAYSPDGRTLLSGGGVDQTVRLWETATGKEIITLKGHKQLVTAVAYSPDGRIISSGSGVNPHYPNLNTEPHRIRFWDAGTGEEIQCLQGYNSNVNSLAFSPDGSCLASGLRNGTVLLWEVPTARARKGATRLGSDERAALWSDLAGEDARKAHVAIWRLAAAPKEVVPFLAERLQPAPPLDEQRVQKLIANLNGDEYAVRQAAMKELAALGELAGPLLRDRLAAKPPLEVRKRVEELLSQTKVLHAGEVVRGVRAVEALEHIGTPDARELLQALANGAPEARLTREAKAALERLANRPLASIRRDRS
jgi:RNA polymerase sigma factor (sigma-70 family)